MKKFLAVAFTALFIGSFSVAYASVDTNEQLELVAEKCAKCGKENCTSCEAKAEKKECSPKEGKSCCAKKGGSEAKSSKEKEEQEVEKK